MSRPEGFDVHLHPGVPQGLPVSDPTSGAKGMWWLEGFEQEDQLALDKLQLSRSGIEGAQGPRRLGGVLGNLRGPRKPLAIDLRWQSVIRSTFADPQRFTTESGAGSVRVRLRRKPSSLWSSSCMIVT